MSSKLAIVMPAYNAGQTLGSSARSVLSQTYQNLELWIVDDGSTDDTLEIADGVKKLDNRVHVLHQANQGAYAARLYALKMINSKWVSFVDADDIISPDLYSEAIAFAETNNLEIVQYDEPDAPKASVPVEIFEGYDIIRKEIIRPRLVIGDGAMLLWDKLYLNTYNYETFPQYKGVTQFDDHIFNLAFFQNVKRVGYLHSKMYDYRPNNKTASKRYSRSALSGLIKALEARRRYLPMFGVADNDRDCLLWLEKNLFNIFCRAAFSRNCSFEAAKSNLEDIELDNIFEECIANDCTWRARTMKLCSRLPQGLVILLARIIHLARDFLKKTL